MSTTEVAAVSEDTASGPRYHRLESPTQTSEDAAEQARLGELWGGIPFGGAQPKVQAYRGPLPEANTGVEFTTDVEPDRGTPPARAHWSGPRRGVLIEGGYARIEISVLKNSQVVA